MRFPQLKALRESRKFALVGAFAGAAHLGGVALKYSKAPHGTTHGAPLRLPDRLCQAVYVLLLLLIVGICGWVPVID
jgi:hypothetical protein